MQVKLLQRIADYFQEWGDAESAPKMELNIDELRYIANMHAVCCRLEKENSVLTEKHISIEPIKQASDEKTHYKCKCGYILRTEYVDGHTIGVIPQYCGNCGQRLKVH